MLTNLVLVKGFHVMLQISPSKDTTMYARMQSFYTAIKLCRIYKLMEVGQ